MTTNQWKSKTINFQQNESEVPKKLSMIWLVGAFGSAVVATFCCLPALLFLLFGTSFGLLSILAPFKKYRVALSVLAILFFAVFVWTQFFRKSCSLNKNLRRRNLMLVVVAFLGLMLLLFYPEILGVFFLYE